MKPLLTFFFLAIAIPAHAADWTGFYAGLSTSFDTTRLEANSLHTDLNAPAFGATLGYNLQFDKLVVGIESDFQFSTARKSESYLAATLDHRLPWFATARARIGYAFDNFMIYATGGVALIDYKAALAAPGFALSDELRRYGLAAGGGAEYAFDTHWSMKAEYLYLDTGKQSVTLLAVPLDVRASENIFRVGLNYRF